MFRREGDKVAGGRLDYTVGGQPKARSKGHVEIKD